MEQNTKSAPTGVDCQTGQITTIIFLSSFCGFPHTDFIAPKVEESQRWLSAKKNP